MATTRMPAQGTWATVAKVGSRALATTLKLEGQDTRIET